MSDRSWTLLKRDASARLGIACPWLNGQPPGLDALSTITALAEVGFSVRTRDNRLDADVMTRPSVKHDILATDLVSMIADTATSYASTSRPESSPAFGDWLERKGFSNMSIALLSGDANWQDLTAAAEIVAGAIRTLSERSKALARTHMGNVLARDLPHALFLRGQLTSVAAWLLAPETSGQPSRREVLTRRVQAMTIYGALAGTLRDADVTAAIDAGLPLAPVLMKGHDLGAAELRALRNGRHLRHSIEVPTDFQVAVQELKAHEVPLHEWPGGGRPGEADEWETSVWAKAPRQHFVRPDFLGLHKDSITDAINALREDLLRPLVAERIRVGGYPPNRNIASFARSVELDAAGGGGAARQRLLRAIRVAILGPRKAGAVQNAVGLWHRRVASLSALRHERSVERPGWPALCAPWTSGCGRYQIVVLASAADLVDEGRILDHCVGGYYDICRRGDTQILSLRQDGKRVATIELKLGADLTAITIEVGQFKAFRNSSPAVDLHDPLRAFLRAVRDGDHPVDGGKLARYRKTMRNVWDGAWNSNALTLAHAREVFPFYLPLLPRGVLAGFDDWCETSGLNAAIDATLAYLEANPR